MDEVAFLEKLLSIPSPTGEEDALATYLVAKMAAVGLDGCRDEVGNAIGIAGDPAGERTIILLGHMDTVPGVIPVRREGGRLYGRGAVDAKGPLAAFLLAAARVAPRLQGACLLVIGAVDEEGGARGARHLARSLPAPCCTVIGEPSGWQGITLGYKGVLSIEYQLTQPSAHSAAGQPSAAERAVRFWNQLGAHVGELNDGRSGRFRTLDPTLRTLNTSSDGLTDRVTMSIVTRLPPGAEASGLQVKMEEWRDGAHLTVHANDPPIEAEKNTPLVRAMLRSIRAAGGRPRFKLKTGTSDMNIVGPVWGCPIIAYGPGDSSLDHTPLEHIEIDEYLRAVDVLARALETLTA